MKTLFLDLLEKNARPGESCIFVDRDPRKDNDYATQLMDQDALFWVQCENGKGCKFAGDVNTVCVHVFRPKARTPHLAEILCHYKGFKNVKLKKLAGLDLSAEEQKLVQPEEERPGERDDADSAMEDEGKALRDGSALLTAHWNVTAEPMRKHSFYISDASKAKQQFLTDQRPSKDKPAKKEKKKGKEKK